jgi:hypothetical protein
VAYSIWWSVALALLGLTGSYLVGRWSAWGWVVCIVGEVVWVAYSMATRQWPFGVTAVAFGLLYARNLRAWRTAPAVSVRERMH